MAIARPISGVPPRERSFLGGTLRPSMPCVAMALGPSEELRVFFRVAGAEDGRWDGDRNCTIGACLTKFQRVTRRR